MNKEFQLNLYNGAWLCPDDGRWKFDTKSKTTKVEWYDIKKLFSKFDIKTDKELVPMCTWCNWIDNPEMKSDKRGRNYVKKVKGNVKSVDVIMLDFDKGISYETFKQKYKNITHMGYTSFNHKIKTPEYDRYRVIIPLNEAIPAELFNDEPGFSIREGLSEFFETVDPISWDLSRGFYLPGCPDHMKQYAHSWVNEGETFNWQKIRLVEIKKPTPRPILRPTAVGLKHGRVLLETLDIVALFVDKGLYIESCGGGTHRVLCPCSSDHTGGDETGTCIMENSGNSWGFRCQHSHGLGSGGTATNKWMIQAFNQVYGNDVFRPFCEVEEHKNKAKLDKLAAMKAKYGNGRAK